MKQFRCYNIKYDSASKSPLHKSEIYVNIPNKEAKTVSRLSIVLADQIYNATGTDAVSFLYEEIKQNKNIKSNKK